VRKQVVVLAVLLCGCGGPSTSEGIEQLRSGDAAGRLRAVKFLGEKRREAATVVPALVRALADEDAFVRRDAARALGGFGRDGVAAQQALTGLLRDPNANVRKAAAQALDKIDPEGAARKGR
jgi:HEAT repeat protein